MVQENDDCGLTDAEIEALGVKKDVYLKMSDFKRSLLSNLKENQRVCRKERKLHKEHYQYYDERLESINSAIRALMVGKSGICVCCKQKISEKRQAAMSCATKCIKCQGEAEIEEILERR